MFRERTNSGVILSVFYDNTVTENVVRNLMYAVTVIKGKLT